MIGFTTRRSTYYVDTVGKTVKGGVLGKTPKEYEQAVIIIGSPAIIGFKDGTCMRTSTVTSYI